LKPYTLRRPSRQSWRWRHSGKPEIDSFGLLANSSLTVFGLPAFAAVFFVEAMMYVFWNGERSSAVLLFLAYCA
jgi:hypothetical protein